MRWRVERAGYPGWYYAGWFAYAEEVVSQSDAAAQHFGTWPEALQYALSMATTEPCS